MLNEHSQVVVQSQSCVPLEWVAISFAGDLPDPGIEPRSPALQTDSLPTELQGKLNTHRIHPQFIPDFKGNVSAMVSWLMVLAISLLCVSHSVVSNSFRPHGVQPARFLCPWDSPGKNTGVGCHFLLQRIFLTQRSNLGQSLGLLHCMQTLYHLSHQVAILWTFKKNHDKEIAFYSYSS